MARTVAELPKGARITDFISLGVISKTFPLDKIKKILNQTGKASQRQRDLPAHVVIYYVIALAPCICNLLIVRCSGACQKVFSG